MRTDDEFMDEVSRRAAILTTRQRKRRKVIAIVAALTVCLTLVVLLSLSISSIRLGENLISNAGPDQAVMLARASVGAYVLVGLASFTLGVIFTLLCVKQMFPARKDTGE